MKKGKSSCDLRGECKGMSYPCHSGGERQKVFDWASMDHGKREVDSARQFQKLIVEGLLSS